MINALQELAPSVIKAGVDKQFKAAVCVCLFARRNQ